jgi:methylthioribose-1-phosphate isomerase
MPEETHAREGIPLPVRRSEDGKAVLLLDQTLLPTEERYLRLESLDEVAEAISSLRVRGAPAIGITAAFGLATATRRRVETHPEPVDITVLRSAFQSDSRQLRRTRPTAVNLPWALDRMESVFESAESGPVPALARALEDEADRIAGEDREMCRRIGLHGRELIPEDGAGILTHCNAGALATGGMGTALAPVYTAHKMGIPIRLFAGETRPLLQGARLTAWEAQRAGVEVEVLTDSMAPALMAQGRVDLVIVGADRVAANGDVANKIGTYGVAVSARHHGIPFYVALPRSTFDPAALSGAQIPIEFRDPMEVRGGRDKSTVPEGAGVWNPAFDVTPSHLVTAFITDGGVLRPPYEPAIADLLGAGGGKGPHGGVDLEEGP